MTDRGILIAHIQEAHVNRAYGERGDVNPSVAEVEVLLDAMDLLNTNGTVDDFIDAQKAVIDALLVAVESGALDA